MEEKEEGRAQLVLGVRWGQLGETTRQEDEAEPSKEQISEEKMTLDGILREKKVYEMRQTQLYGMTVHVAEDKEENVGFIDRPDLYELIGMDEEFRKVYQRRER